MFRSSDAIIFHKDVEGNIFALQDFAHRLNLFGNNIGNPFCTLMLEFSEPRENTFTATSLFESTNSVSEVKAASRSVVEEGSASITLIGPCQSPRFHYVAYYHAFHRKCRISQDFPSISDNMIRIINRYIHCKYVSRPFSCSSVMFRISPESLQSYWLVESAEPHLFRRHQTRRWIKPTAVVHPLQGPTKVRW